MGWDEEVKKAQEEEKERIRKLLKELLAEMEKPKVEKKGGKKEE